MACMVPIWKFPLVVPAMTFVVWFALSGIFDPPCIAADREQMLIEILNKMDSSYSRVNDYTATFHKQERIGGELLESETFLFKFMKPFKIYMKGLDGPSRGTEVLFVKGRYDDKMLARATGLKGLMTLSLDPRGWLAMSRNRHPVTEAGLGFLLSEFKRNMESAVRLGEIEVTRFEDEPFQGRPATVVEGRFLPREGRKYYCSRFIVHVDKELVLPVGNFFYDEHDRLFEKYIMADVKLNVGLTAMDFSRYNKDYRF